MAFPQDQINNNIAVGSLIRDGLDFAKDELLSIKNKTWFYRACIDYLGLKIGSNPGVNTRLDGTTTMYKVVWESSLSTFREIHANENTDIKYDEADKFFQIEVPFAQGITQSKPTTLSEFLTDEQTGKQLEQNVSTYAYRMSQIAISQSEVVAKWIDYKMMKLLFKTDYSIKTFEGNTNPGSSTMKLSYDALNEIGTLSSYKDIYKIEEQLILTEELDRFSTDILGILAVPYDILKAWKNEFKNDAGFNAMTAIERDRYVAMNRVQNEFIFPDSRIVVTSFGYHLEGQMLNDAQDLYVGRFISREAIGQMNFLPNIIDDFQRFEQFHFVDPNGQYGVINGGQEFPLSMRGAFHRPENKLGGFFHWYAASRFTLRPNQPKRSVHTFALDNTKIAPDDASLAEKITKSLAYESKVLDRITNA